MAVSSMQGQQKVWNWLLECATVMQDEELLKPQEGELSDEDKAPEQESLWFAARVS